MSDNLAIWNTLGRTSPEHTKQFKRGGGFTGTAIKPIYTEQKMTEQFGPCGIGWGFSEPQFQIVPGANSEVMVYCWLTLWFVHEGARSAPIPGVGGDKIISHIKANEQYKRPERWESDDEAFKKAFTDAIGNAMKHIGMSADVHMGLFDDSKYVSDLRREDAETNSQSAPMTGRSAAGAGTLRTQDEPAASHSEAYKIALAAMKLSRSKAELTAWWNANKDNIKASMPDSESLLLVGERNTLGFSLPAVFQEAAE
jgi:hypothetical protein